ncbi:MAG: cytochrome c biogenesis protein CcsA [Deltaproteobacteria bacterium]|nr:cytochrome c biogenesis protein CcsA [Deltaproteobacteria bacterium]
MATTILLVALCAYGAATALFIAHLMTRRVELATWALRALVTGTVFHFVGKAVRFSLLGTIPITDGTEALGGLALVIAVLFIWAARRYRVPVLGAFATPLVFVTLAASLAFSGESGPVPEALRSAWFPVHIFLAISADACFAVAGVAAAAFLMQEGRLRQKQLGGASRLLPPLHVLEEIGQRFVMTGFLLLTLAIVAGSFFAKQMWGAYWSWDPKQCWTLVTWLFFAGILHARITIGWRGRRQAWLTVIAVVLVIVAMVGLNFLVRTRHGGEFDGEKNVPAYLRAPKPLEGF